MIHALSKKASFVPYRESKLTRLLQNSLGGNSITIMIATVSPVQSTINDSISTLRFAELAKDIRNDARINVDPVHAKLLQLMALVKELSSENESLREQLSAALNGNMTLEQREATLLSLTESPRPAVDVDMDGLGKLQGSISAATTEAGCQTDEGGRKGSNSRRCTIL